MRFKNRRFVTRGVADKVAPFLQAIMWGMVDSLPIQKDYFQVFEIRLENGQLKLIHTQEEPEYKREYLLGADSPIFMGKIYAIDSDVYSTMLLAEEY